MKAVLLLQYICPKYWTINTIAVSPAMFAKIESEPVVHFWCNECRDNHSFPTRELFEHAQ